MNVSPVVRETNVTPQHLNRLILFSAPILFSIYGVYKPLSELRSVKSFTQSRNFPPPYIYTLSERIFYTEQIFCNSSLYIPWQPCKIFPKGCCIFLINLIFCCYIIFKSQPLSRCFSHFRTNIADLEMKSMPREKHASWKRHI